LELSLGGISPQKPPVATGLEPHFSGSDSAPASGFKTPAPTRKKFETSTPTPVYTPKTSK